MRRLYFLFHCLESCLISCYVSCVITDHSFSLGVFQNPCPILVCISTFRGSWYKYLFLCMLLLTDHGTLICSAVLLNSHFSPRRHCDKCKVSAIPWLVVKYQSHALPRFFFVSLFLNTYNENSYPTGLPHLKITHLWSGKYWFYVFLISCHWLWSVQFSCVSSVLGKLQCSSTVSSTLRCK